MSVCLADYHVHSNMSDDGTASMLDMARAAKAAGLDEVCFTDHFEAIHWTDRRGSARKSFDYARLHRAFAEAREGGGELPELKLGLEIGDVYLTPETALPLLKGAEELDFTIGSVHMLPEQYGFADFSTDRPGSLPAAEDRLRAYVKALDETVALGGFTVLGHLTLPLRYYKRIPGLETLSFDAVRDETEAVLSAAIDRGLAIELNVNRGGEMLPDSFWLKRYREKGGERITLGSDAHRTSDVGRGIREGQALLRACGFKYFCTYSRQEAIFHKL